jgi:hypothetical protein
MSVYSAIELCQVQRVEAGGRIGVSVPAVYGLRVVSARPAFPGQQVPALGDTVAVFWPSGERNQAARWFWTKTPPVDPPDPGEGGGTYVSATTTTTAPTVLDSAVTTSVKYLIETTRGSDREFTEIAGAVVGSEVDWVEYGLVSSNNPRLSTFTLSLVSGEIRLITTPGSASSTTFKAQRLTAAPV